ncbi:hypothetical protein Slin14017_G122770 [Septoria linicola]|nr:hypothetical protein Slin14017_G122770 [Septoria linicola]
MLPSLANRSAELGRFTRKTRRTLRDELQDRATSAKLGTFSSHSLILSFVSFLEVVNAHRERITGDDAAQQRLRREIARLQMGAASLPSSGTALFWLAIGNYVHQSRVPGPRPQLVFLGTRFRGVLTGGVFAKRIVE